MANPNKRPPARNQARRALPRDASPTTEQGNGESEDRAVKHIEVGTKLYIVGPRDQDAFNDSATALVVHELLVKRAGTKEVLVQSCLALRFASRLIVNDEGRESPFHRAGVRFTAEEAIRYAIEASKNKLKRLHQEMVQESKRLHSAEDLLVDLQAATPAPTPTPNGGVIAARRIEGDGTIDPSIMVITDAPTPEKRCGHIIDLNNEACGNPVPCKRHP